MERQTNKGKSSVHAMAARSYYHGKIAQLKAQLKNTPGAKARRTIKTEIAQFERKLK